MGWGGCVSFPVVVDLYGWKKFQFCFVFEGIDNCIMKSCYHFQRIGQCVIAMPKFSSCSYRFRSEVNPFHSFAISDIRFRCRSMG